MAYRAEVDKRSCQSSGRCLEAAPGHFAWDDDQVAEFRPGPEPLADEALLAIARRCPALAIAVFDERGEEIDF